LSKLEHEDTDTTDQDKSSLVKTLLNQINHMIKLNPARCEQLALLDGISVLTKLAQGTLHNSYTQLLISIFSELINSTKIVREILKKINTLELIISFIKNKIFKDNLLDVIRNLLEWLEYDKVYVENALIQDNIFNNLFLDINEVMNNRNLSEHISLLLEFFHLSENIENKYFSNKVLVKIIMESIVSSNIIDQKDIHLLNRVMDFCVSLARNKKSDANFLSEIHFNEILNKIKAISKEKNLIIIEEKIKKIQTFLNKN
jgi:hypothetical protein